MEENQVLSAFGALSNEQRLGIVRYLVGKGESGESAGVIGEALDLSPSNASFHLSALTKAGLLQSTRVSRQIVYRADFSALGGLVSYLLKDCCQGNEEVMQCCGIKLSDSCC